MLEEWLTGMRRVKHSISEDSLRFEFPATAIAAGSCISALAAELAKRGLQGERASDVKIAFAEAINNVVEHAYAGLEPERVQVDCTFRSNRLDVLIVDTGRPLPGLRLPDGRPADIETDLQNLPEGGFGWFLIRQLTSTVVYERRNGSNRLRLGFDLDPRKAPRAVTKRP